MGAPGECQRQKETPGDLVSYRLVEVLLGGPELVDMPAQGRLALQESWMLSSHDLWSRLESTAATEEMILRRKGLLYNSASDVCQNEDEKVCLLIESQSGVQRPAGFQSSLRHLASRLNSNSEFLLQTFYTDA